MAGADDDRPAVAADLLRLLAEIEEIRAETARRGIPVVILLTGNQAADGSFLPDLKELHRSVAEYCETRGLLAIDPIPALEESAAGKPVHRFPEDHHWSEFAHEVAAATVADRLTQAGLLQPSRQP